jgi:hypothetical protein
MFYCSSLISFANKKRPQEINFSIGGLLISGHITGIVSPDSPAFPLKI